MKLDSLSILIPAYNDAATIKDVVRDALRVGRRWSKTFEVVVINDGSTDGTGAILAREKKHTHQLIIQTHEQNFGYGKTIKELYYLAKKQWLFTIPGDRQVRAEELQALLRHGHNADMIVGWRRDRQDPLPRKMQSTLYNGLLRLFFGVTLHDANSVRLMRTDILKKIHLNVTSAFVDAELAIKAQKAGFRVIEVPIRHYARVGSQGSGGAWWTIMPTIWEMVRFKIRA